MKKIFTLMLLSFVVAGIVKAEEYVAFQPTSPVRISWDNNTWEGSYYDTSSKSSDGAFKSLSANDVIKIHITGIVGTANSDSQAAISIKAGSSWEWSTLPSDLVSADFDNGIITVSVKAGNSKYTTGGTETNVSWTADEMATYIKERGLIVSGIKYKLLDITVETSNITNAAQTFFTGQDYDLGSWTWDNRIQLLPWKYNLAKLKAGDILKIDYTTNSLVGSNDKHGQMNITNSSGDLIAGTGYYDTPSSSNTLSVTLTDEIIAKLASGEYYITGDNIHVNSMISESDKYTYNDAALPNAETDMGTGWSPSIQMNSLITDYSSFSIGDILAISYTTAASYETGTYGQIQIQYKWADTSNGGSVYANFSSIDANTSGTLYIPITADLLSKLDEDNIQIKGQNVTIPANGIQFIHYVTPAGYRPVYIPDGGYATFCGTSTCALPENVTAYYVSAVSDNSATLTSISNIPANQGVILKGAKGIYQLYTTTDDAASVTDNKLVGVTTRSQITETDNKYVLYDNNGSTEFRKITANTYLDAYKCYLSTASSGNAPSLNIVLGGSATTIDTPKTVVKTDDRIYTLSGQEVKTPTRGIYIRNGKKYIIK